MSFGFNQVSVCLSYIHIKLGYMKAALVWMLFLTLFNSECVGPSSFSSLMFWYHTEAGLRLLHTDQRDRDRDREVTEEEICRSFDGLDSSAEK